MISNLRDIAEDVFCEEIPSMPAVPVPLPPGHADRERQYREFWPAVRALLNTRYRGLDEQQELYQEAWTELLEYEAGGNEVRDTRALLKTIAERRARDRIRNYRPVVVEPDSSRSVAPLTRRRCRTSRCRCGSTRRRSASG